MSDLLTRKVYKTVTVPIDIDSADLARTLSAADLKAACRQRGIALVEDKPAGRKFKILRDDMANVIDLHRRGDLSGALVALERILPHPLRNLSLDVERHYRT